MIWGTDKYQKKKRLWTDNSLLVSCLVFHSPIMWSLFFPAV